MSSYTAPVSVAAIIFFILSFLLIIPWLIYSYRKFGYLSFWSSVVVFSFIFYMLSAYFLVILPLPDTQNTCALQPPDTVPYQLVPFYFVWDTLKGSSVVWNHPATYIQIFKQGAFFPAAYNLLLLLPLGVYLRYFFRSKQYWKYVWLIGFLVSLFFEITQLTGLYGIYNCPYRLFNVDDLLLNSVGALTGFLIAPVILALFPSRASVLAKKDAILKRNIVLPIPQLLAILIDSFLVNVSWAVAGLFMTTGNIFIEMSYKTAALFVAFFIVPIIWKGKTVGTNFMRFKLMDTGGRKPQWSQLLKRFFALYLPWLTYRCLKIISNMELDHHSVWFIPQIWLYILSVLATFILVAVLTIHTILVIFKKGQRLFYFDHVANVLPRYSKERSNKE